MPTPAGVSDSTQADAYLAKTDPCNTHQFPDEEFWTYHATSVTSVLLSYDCTHFEPYLDPHFEQIVSDQIQFLQRHVPISS